LDSGCEKYQPHTDAGGSIAKLDVSIIPVFFSAWSSLNSVSFSEWSGQAGYPGAGLIP